MRFATFTVVFFLTLSFFAFGQSTEQQSQAFNEGIRAAQNAIVNTPYPLSNPYAGRNEILANKFIEGWQRGQADKRTAELVRDGYKIEPFYESSEERNKKDPFSHETETDHRFGFNLVIPF
jgi:hypothetical protein